MNRSEGRDSAQENKQKKRKRKRNGVIIILQVQKNTKEIGKNRTEPHSNSVMMNRRKS